MIVRGESTIIDYNAPFDQGLKITISEERIDSYDRKAKFALKYLQRRCKHFKTTAPPTGN